MNIQVLFSTMYQLDFGLTERANIQDSYVVVNQTDFSKFPNLRKFEKAEVFVSLEERGLSRSRNKAIDYASGDICVLADDDVYYVPNYKEAIEEAYNKYKEADIILFDIIEPSGRRRKSVSKKDGKINFFKILRGNSIRITFKLNSIKNNSIRFNENFGSGSGKFIASEDIVFLVDCMRKGLKVYYVSIPIVGLFPSESTWFKGYNREYFQTVGAFSYHYMRRLWFVYCWQFLLRHRELLTKFSIGEAFKYCKEGVEMLKKLSIK